MYPFTVPPGNVFLATCRDLPEPDSDAPLLHDALLAAGCTPTLAAWDDDAIDWSKADLCVIRSTWNYYHRRDAFLAWAERVARVTKLFNPLRTIEWNTDKHYLAALAARGVAIVPTAFADRGSGTNLRAIVEARGWRDVVIKPTISAASFSTMRVRVDRDLEAGELHLASLLETRDAMIQEYAREVDASGERSLVWIDGAIEHAIRKSPRFHGAHEATTPVPIADDERAFAERVLAAANQANLLYARIDIVRGSDGAPTLMELELTEPSLFFEHAPKPLARFAAAIARQL